MKKIIALVLAVVMIFSFAACGKDDNLTTNKVLKVADKLADGKKADNSDFSGYACEESENVYKTYTYTIDDETSVIVTTDKKTGETLQMYLFRGSRYINLKDGKDAVEKFLEETEGQENTVTTKQVESKTRTTTKKETTTTTTQAYQNTTAAAATAAGTTAAATTAATTTTVAETTTAPITTAAPETTTAAIQ